MDLRSGLRLNESTQRSWNELADANNGQTRIRLQQPFAMTCVNGEQEVTTTIPAATEVMLFCHMKGPYKQVNASAKRRTLGTFFIEGAEQISVLSDGSVRVVNPQQPTVPRSEMQRGMLHREPLLITARW